MLAGAGGFMAILAAAHDSLEIGPGDFACDEWEVHGGERDAAITGGER